jgi:hypothetical protein
MPPDVFGDGNGTRCLSGMPVGERIFTAGCLCEFCQRHKDKTAPRDITLQDILTVASRHHNCRGNILNAMLIYRATETDPKVQGFLYDSGFTNAEIKVGREALDTACRFVEKLKDLGYKWDPKLRKPIAPVN